MRYFGRSELGVRVLDNKANKILIDLANISNDFQIKISKFWVEIEMSREEYELNRKYYIDFSVVKDNGNVVFVVPGSIMVHKMERA